MSGREHFDILVLGGGTVGLAFTCLAHSLIEAPGRLRIGLVERQPPEPSAATDDWDLRVSALSPASRRLLQRCGAWELLPPERVSPYRRMSVWHHAGRPRGEKSIQFDAADMGEPALGYIVENRAVRQALWTMVSDQADIECINSKPVSLSRQDSLELEMDNGLRVSADLLVGADGARSWLRNALGVATRGQDYRQRGVVTHVHTQVSHAETAWQCFHPGGPVALLPLSDGRSSVVWSCPDAQAAELLDCSDEEFARLLESATGSVLGEVSAGWPRAAFPLVSLSARHYVGEGFALIGDAAHQIHPLAGQGANLGLLDAASLAECLAQHLRARGALAGDARALKRYERWRRGHNEVTMAMMSLLHGIFDGPGQVLPLLGGMGLEAVDHLGPVKHWLAERAMGQGSDLPASARG